MAVTTTENRSTGPKGRARRVRQDNGGTTSLVPPGRRVRLPELAVGVLVMAVFAIGVVLWHLRSVDRVPALALAGPVARGEVVEVEDLRVVNVSADRAVARLDASASDRVVGRMALVDLPAGSIVSEGMVADSSTVGPDEGVVGLSLEPGQYPSVDIAPGDRVNVVVSAGGAAAAPAGAPALAREAEVVGVEDLNADRKLVSIKTTEGEAEAIASRDGSTLRLVRVAP